ncbi:DUF11 domain-containing protein [Hamadaea tsunoensis]|uniref:DUF11 domain-containing protein n=1 Tax=Hamadaea tsunoensis TaxID=53368 RepID=UPI0003FD4EE7|nr:DUF11 domain-containing protein [Hamadaea tsunoensis]
MLRRLATSAFIMFLGLAGMALAGPPAPAYAATAGAAPFFVTYGSGLTTTIGHSSATSVPIGVQAWGSTAITNAVVTLDAGAISAKVKVVGATGPCTHTSTKITCSFGTVAKTKKTAYAVFQAVDGAPAGLAGTVKLHLTGSPSPTDPNATGTIHIAGEADVADMAVSSNRPRGDVGQTVTVTTTIRNNGPGVQPWIELSAYRLPPGMSYAGGSGCVKYAAVFVCRKENMAPGTSATVKLMLHIDRCDKGYAQGYETAGESIGTALSDPNQTNNDFRLKITVNGCYTSGSGSSGTTTTTTGTRPQASRSPQPGASASPSAAASASPSAEPSSEAPVAASSAAAQPTPEAAADSESDGGAVGLVIGVLAAAALLGAGVVGLRRRRATSADTAE